MENAFPLCDIHLHIMEPHSLVPPQDFQSPTLENADTVVQMLAACELQQACIPAITLYDAEDLPCNPLALYAKTLQPDRLFALAGLRRSCIREQNADMAQQARELLAAGFDGFKMICKPNALRRFPLAIDDTIFDEFYTLMEQTQTPILFHIGDPESFWDAAHVPAWATENGWYYGGEALPTMQELYAQTEHMLSKFPKLNMTLAHFFFTSANLPYANRLLERFPNLRLDVTPGSEMYMDFSQNPSESRAFFEHWSGRIVLGTDNVGANGKLAVEQLEQGAEKVNLLRRFFATNDTISFYGTTLTGIGLNTESCQELFAGAFYRFLGKEAPAKVDRAGVQSLCDQYLQLTADEHTVNLLRKLQAYFAD